MKGAAGNLLTCLPADTDSAAFDQARETSGKLTDLDQAEFLAAHPPRHRTAILVLVEGGTMREAGKRCGLVDSAALNLRRRIAADLIEFFGPEVIRRLLDGIRPGWESDLRMSRERHLCHCHAALGQDAASPTRS